MNLFYEVKQAVNCIEVARHYGMDIKRTGKNHKACCPFHSDTNPSLVIYPDGYKCFSCGESGSAIDLVSQLCNIKLIEACKLLIQDFKLAINLDNIKPNKKAIADRKNDNNLLNKFEELKKLAFTTLCDRAIYIHKVLPEMDYESPGYPTMIRRVQITNYHLDILMRDKDEEDIQAQIELRSLCMSKQQTLKVLKNNSDIQSLIMAAIGGYNESEEVPLHEKYFNGKTFIPKRLADDLMDKHQFKFAGDTLWVYRDGCYRTDGAEFAAREAQELLEEATRSGRIQETIDYIKRECVTKLPEPSVRNINLKNGRLDWAKRELKPHDPKHFDIVQLPVNYDPEAKCPNFDKYLSTTLDSEVATLAEEVYGYCLIPSTRFEKAIMLVGAGSNGKSVFLDVLQYLLGEKNISNIELQELEENRFKAAGLLGKLANIFADLSSKAMKSSSMFKTLVTGDRVTAERKFGQPFEFNNYAKLLFSANEPPRNSDKTFAYYRRWIIIPFTRTFDKGTADRGLRNKLQAETAGILNKALDGLHRLVEQGEFSQPPQTLKALEAYQTHNDTAAAFANEMTEESLVGKVAKQKLYEAYRDWCTDQGIHPVSQRKLKDSLQAMYPNLDEYRDGNYGSWCWLGIELIEEK